MLSLYRSNRRLHIILLLLQIVLIDFSYQIININIFCFSLSFKLFFLLFKVCLIELFNFMHVLNQETLNQIIINFNEIVFDLVINLQGFKWNIWTWNELSFIEFIDNSLLKFSSQIFCFLLHRGIPVILDRVVSPTFEYFSNFCPFVTNFSVLKKKGPFFLNWPIFFFDFWIEMIVPSFSALLSYSPR